jgi:small subunit ribosomal protein S7e
MSFPQPLAYDVEQKLRDMDSVPLFMKGLPTEGEQSEALEALQALVYDGTPDGI